MKIKSDFYIKKTDNNTVIVCCNNPQKIINNIVLDEIAVFLWETLSQNDMGKEQLLNALLERFDISTVLALNDIDIFVKTLKENDILE